MRVLTLAVLTIATGLATEPVKAQTYDPRYPVCLHIYLRGGDYFECSYTSLAQCAASASGRAAMCMQNPYFANAQGRRGPRYGGRAPVNNN